MVSAVVPNSVPSKLRVTGLCVGNPPGTGEFPAQMASNVENASIWWRNHGFGLKWFVWEILLRLRTNNSEIPLSLFFVCSACLDHLTHSDRGKMTAILQTTLSNAFSWMKMLEFRLKFHWSHYLNHCWSDYWCIRAPFGLNELTSNRPIALRPYLCGCNRVWIVRGLRTRYVKFRVAHATGILAKCSPPSTSKETPG